MSQNYLLEHPKLKWDDAVEFCKNLDFAGYNDWKLPTAEELGIIGIYRQKDIDLSIFKNMQSSWYWSSTTFPNDTDVAWYVNMYNGYMTYHYKTVSNYVWPVRGVNYDYLGNLVIHNLKDNEPLFEDLENGIILDNRTGLMWIK